MTVSSSGKCVPSRTTLTLSWPVIRAGLVSGKLSQVNSSFRVYRSTYRTFGAEQWQLLEQRLVQWQSSIDRILATITEARAGGEPAAVAAV